MLTGFEGRALSLRVLGLALVSVASIALLCPWPWLGASRGDGQRAPLGSLVGYPDQVDALSLLPIARGLVEYEQLSRVIAVGVSREGSLNLAEGQAGARFEFYRFVVDSAPAGTKRAAAAKLCGRQTVQLTRQGLYSDPALPEVSCALFEPRGLPEPTCTLRQIWKMALDDGADPSFPAVIEYLLVDGRPAWRFSHLRQNLTKVYPPDCSTRDQPTRGQ